MSQIFRGITSSECADECSCIDDCEAFTYNQRSDTCYLKQECRLGSEASRNEVTGNKQRLTLLAILNTTPFLPSEKTPSDMYIIDGWVIFDDCCRAPPGTG